MKYAAKVRARSNELRIFHFYLRNHLSYLSISISILVIIFTHLMQKFLSFLIERLLNLVVNYYCDALLNIL